jgi:O-acetyl-ADP-ribose deacetylase
VVRAGRCPALDRKNARRNGAKRQRERQKCQVHDSFYPWNPQKVHDKVNVVSTLKFETTLPDGKTLSLYQGDLTDEKVDAIVNAANEGLSHGGGVAGAIVRKGGIEIQDESDRLGKIKTGQAVVTGAGRLPCRWVIHAVGPVWPGNRTPEQNDALLTSAVTQALERAHERECRSIAFPAISSGIFGFPKDRCARVLIEVLLGWNQPTPTELRLTIIDDITVGVFERELRSWFGAKEI